jgi:hypothetical protein
MAPPDDYRMKASAAFYLGAAPTAETKRVSNVLLDLRPGALIVVAPRAIGGERKD